MDTNTTAPAAPARCARPGCGRALTSPKSVERGFGPTCWARIQRSARNTRFSPTVQSKADELTGIGIRVDGRELLLFPSSDGTDTYRTTPNACTCKAGLLQRRNKAGIRFGCSHQMAAERRFRASAKFSPSRVFAL